MKSRIATAALAFAIVMALAAPPAHAQTTPTPIPFTLNWEATTSFNTTFYVHTLLSYNGQPATYSVCGQSEGGYNIWCGEVVHYAANPALDPVDFNFPDQFLLDGCSTTASQFSTVYTSPTRRTITVNSTFACTDHNGAGWTVQTTTLTKQYLAACRFRACWGVFNAGFQSPITGTVTQD
jgi:hypothetical protein